MRTARYEERPSEGVAGRERGGQSGFEGERRRHGRGGGGRNEGAPRIRGTGNFGLRIGFRFERLGRSDRKDPNPTVEAFGKRHVERFPFGARLDEPAPPNGGFDARAAEGIGHRAHGGARFEVPAEGGERGRQRGRVGHQVLDQLARFDAERAVVENGACRIGRRVVRERQNAFVDRPEEDLGGAVGGNRHGNRARRVRALGRRDRDLRGAQFTVDRNGEHRFGVALQEARVGKRRVRGVRCRGLHHGRVEVVPPRGDAFGHGPLDRVVPRFDVRPEGVFDLGAFKRQESLAAVGGENGKLHAFARAYGILLEDRLHFGRLQFLRRGFERVGRDVVGNAAERRSVRRSKLDEEVARFGGRERHDDAPVRPGDGLCFARGHGSVGFADRDATRSVFGEFRYTAALRKARREGRSRRGFEIRIDERDFHCDGRVLREPVGRAARVDQAPARHQARRRNKKRRLFRHGAAAFEFETLPMHVRAVGGGGEFPEGKRRARRARAVRFDGRNREFAVRDDGSGQRIEEVVRFPARERDRTRVGGKERPRDRTAFRGRPRTLYEREKRFAVFQGHPPRGQRARIDRKAQRLGREVFDRHACG